MVSRCNHARILSWLCRVIAESAWHFACAGKLARWPRQRLEEAARSSASAREIINLGLFLPRRRES